MRTRQISLAVLAVVCWTSMLGAQRPAPLARQTWTVDGVERSALVSIPATPAPATGFPLVLVFHGHGGSSLNAARTFGTHTLWPEAIVVYPQGLPTPGRITDPEGQRAGWQHQPGEQGDRDLKLVDAILAWAKSEQRIDAKRLFATGHSNGGSMVYTLWSARHEVFAAFAPSSSVFPRAIVTSAKPKPAFIVAGQQDALVPFAAQKLSLTAVLRLNQAESAGVSWSGTAVLHRSPVGADVVAHIHPGGHPMPDDAGKLIVQFFKTRPGAGP